MGLLTQHFVTKQAPVNMTGRIINLPTAPQSTNDEAFLRYYKQISWVRAAISLIAQGIAQTKWYTEKVSRDGERERVEDHELTRLLRRPNPFQSGYDFFYLDSIFEELIGRNFWVKQKNFGDRELWLLPPQYTQPIADPTDYISGYVFSRNSYEKKFKPEEIIYFNDPDPLDPMQGAGRAQSVGLDIENQSFMSQWNRNFFFWGADAGTVITYPPEAQITTDELDRLNEQWNAGHRSYGRAHKAAIFTQGATIQHSTIGQRDMDWSGLANYNQKSILGVFGVSYSMIGGTDNVIRANAEAQLFNFARWVLMPRLIRKRERINMSLAPEFGEDIEVNFEDPTPENKELDLQIARGGWDAGFMKRNESRKLMHLDPDISSAGEEYKQTQSSMFDFGSFNSNQDKPTKSLKRKGFTEETKAYIWNEYVKRTESSEKPLIQDLMSLWRAQQKEALSVIIVNQNTVLLDGKKAREQTIEKLTPEITSAFLDAQTRGYNLVVPSNPHKNKEVNQAALEWLKRRMTWLAEGITAETEQLLKDALAEGFKKGESLEKIAARVKEVFEFNNAVRAMRIARTEVIAASNAGLIEGYRESGVVEKKEWMAALDERTRESHVKANGQTVALNDNFIIGEGAGPGPGQINLPGESINCRCVCLPVITD